MSVARITFGGNDGRDLLVGGQVRLPGVTDA
jgi:hypothetical protein